MKRLKIVFLALIAMALSATTALATYQADFAYDYVSNGSNNYTFVVTITNTSTGGDTGGLDFFQIDLDADDISLYSNVSWVEDNGWMSDNAEYDPAYGGSPAYVNADDSFMGTGGGGIAQGDSLTFKFSFDYTGSLGLDQQLFSWEAYFGTYEDNSTQEGYSYLGDVFGQLRYAGGQGPAPVPEPSTIILFATGLGGLFAAGRKHMTRK